MNSPSEEMLTRPLTDEESAKLLQDAIPDEEDEWFMHEEPYKSTGKVSFAKRRSR